MNRTVILVFSDIEFEINEGVGISHYDEFIRYCNHNIWHQGRWLVREKLFSKFVRLSSNQFFNEFFFINLFIRPHTEFY